MNLLLSRILTYLNGTLFNVNDDYYRLSRYIVLNYIRFEDITLEEILKDTCVSEQSALQYFSLYGFSNFDEFKATLVNDYYTRLDQIHARMLGLSSDKLIHDMEKDCSDEEMKAYISRICESIDQAERVVLFGALYPLCISVELQTDLITFGKPVIQYHSWEKLELTNRDVAIFVSATGRAMRDFLRIKQEVHLENATSILITQNKIYTQKEHRMSNYVITLPGRFDGINFNYQIMTIYDVIRVHYYTQYYLGEKAANLK